MFGSFILENLGRLDSFKNNQIGGLQQPVNIMMTISSLNFDDPFYSKSLRTSSNLINVKYYEKIDDDELCIK